jgi:hypothetical protein
LPARQSLGVDKVDRHRPDHSRITVGNHVRPIRAKPEE